MLTIPSTELTQLAQEIIQSLGTPLEQAQVVATSLVEANLVGHDSHGVLRLVPYAAYVQQRLIRPAAQPVITTRRKAVVQVDGRWSWGQLGAQLATRSAIAQAQETGLGSATLDRCAHVGRMGEYVAMIAAEDMIGMAICNHQPAVAPFGGRERRMGTNPIAWGIPRGPGLEPILVDFATASVAEGKLKVARSKGEQVAPGLIIDREGRATQNPEDFYKGGALLPFGGHKGYGLSLVVELLSGILSGAGPSILPTFQGANGTMILAMEIEAFVSLATFYQQVNDFCAQIKSSLPADGFDEIMLPGEPEIRARAERQANGIPIPESVWADLQILAA